MQKKKNKLISHVNQENKWIRTTNSLKYGCWNKNGFLFQFISDIDTKLLKKLHPVWVLELDKFLSQNKLKINVFLVEFSTNIDAEKHYDIHQPRMKNKLNFIKISFMFRRWKINEI